MSNEYILRQDMIDLWNKYRPTIAVDAIDYDMRLKRLPSADVVQVRHGRWIKVGVWGRVYKCNQCGNFLDFDGVNAGRGAANFCPNCGAKMDGQGEE